MTRPDHAPIPGTEREPLDSFLERVRPRVKRLLRSFGIPPEDAEDLLQEALLEAVRKWDTIQHLEAWLFGTLSFKCSKYWRHYRGGRVQAVDTPVLEELAQPQAPAQEREEVIHDLQNLLRGLGKRHRTVLWLRFGLGLSTLEIAERLGYCPSSIRKLTTRSMERLSRRVSDSSS